MLDHHFCEHSDYNLYCIGLPSYHYYPGKVSEMYRRAIIKIIFMRFLDVEVQPWWIIDVNATCRNA